MRLIMNSLDKILKAKRRLQDAIKLIREGYEVPEFDSVYYTAQLEDLLEDLIKDISMARQNDE